MLAAELVTVLRAETADHDSKVRASGKLIDDTATTVSKSSKKFDSFWRSSILGAAKLSSALPDVKKHFFNMFGGVTNLIKPVGLLTAGATALSGVIGKQFVDAANESIQVTAQLDSVLTSTAGKAGVSKKAALDLADALSSKSGLSRFTDEAILSAENMLLTFTNIGSKVFPDATKTALNMSQALGQCHF